jgi:hypothetical protein
MLVCLIAPTPLSCTMLLTRYTLMPHSARLGGQSVCRPVMAAGGPAHARVSARRRCIGQPVPAGHTPDQLHLAFRGSMRLLRSVKRCETVQMSSCYQSLPSMGRVISDMVRSIHISADCDSAL